MLVYGDHVRERDTRTLIGELAATLTGEHDAIVTTFIAASELAQGIADAEYAVRDEDARSLATDTAMALLVALARAIDASWAGLPPALDAARAQLAALAALPLPPTVRTKRAEGHAYYAVYPEAYLAAARRSSTPPDHVIGIRSIGCGLAALVAAATGAPLPATVRPHGDPFRRSVRVAPGLVAEWLDDPRATFAIADEGPGISGSSFGAIADLLEDHGVAADRLVYFPSHPGLLGEAASPRHRDRWARARRHVVTADELLRDRLASWIEAVVGTLVEPLVELSAGAWRRLRYARETEWPPSFVQQERLKVLAHTRTGRWLARFVGLGAAGGHALDLARATSAAGFTPQVAGLRHGFLIERWIDGAAALEPDAFGRERLLAHLARYLALRATRRGEPGASCTELIAMVRRNVTLGAGAHVADRVVGELAPIAMEPVEIDGKLQAWEWLVQSDGTLIKTDAYDHHAAHDLIGCQDIAWDVAGAAIELGLGQAEERWLAGQVGVDLQRLAFVRPCYLAFQLGRARLAADASDAAEASRLRDAADRYARLVTSRC